jgi:REP element-mobilizing transposase RayT
LGDKFNGIDFKVSKVEALPEPEFSETMQYRLQTPWVVSYILDGWKLSLTGLRAPSGIKLKTNNMQKFEPLTYGNYFHIYNRGINSCNIFAENENYEYFLHLYDEKISPVADTYAWALMPNHFHFLVRIKPKEEIPEVINILNPDGALSPVRVGTPAKQFSKFFNSYAQAINKRYHRHGGLFERPFKRKRIDNLLWLKRVILYIHNNPVHHGFCNHPLEYPWTSYLSCISVKPTKLQREKVIGWFDEKANFVTRHNERLDITEIEDFLGVYETRELPKTDEDDIMNLNPDGASSPVKAGKNKKPEK